MNKSDGRYYNRKSNRDLAIEMNLWIALKGKLIEAVGSLSDDKPVFGLITDVIYEPGRKNTCRINIDNGSEFCFKVKHGKIILPKNVTII